MQILRLYPRYYESGVKTVYSTEVDAARPHTYFRRMFSLGLANL